LDPLAVNTTTEATTHRKCRSSLGSREDEGMARRLVLLLVAGAIHSGNVLAQQPVQPLPKVGGSPLGYYGFGRYCVPSSGGNTRCAIQMSGVYAVIVH